MLAHCTAFVPADEGSSASYARLRYSVLLLIPVAPVISEMVCAGRLLEVDALASGALERVDLAIGPPPLSRHPRIPESHIAPILVPKRPF